MDDLSTVLFVDNEPAIADGHAARLADEYETLTAYDGQSALEIFDDRVDVVCLDRRMPGLSGEEVLESIRERGDDCRVVMLTGVEPDFDIVEMGFDEYLVKPIGKAELRETIDRLVTAAADAVDDAILDTLGDPKTRRCCYALVDAPRSAQELATVTGYSLPTVYRRLNALQQAGMIDAHSTLDPGGDHYKTFAAVTTRIRVEIDDGVRIDVERTDEQPV